MSAIEDQQISTAKTAAGVIAHLADVASNASQKIELVEIGPRAAFSIPSGRTIESLENPKWLNAPYRSTGMREVNDSASFLALVNRFTSGPRPTIEADTVVRFCLAKLYAQAVFNYPALESPAWGDHGAKWQLVKHRDLLAWEAITGKWLPQVQLMEFLEDHIQDITGKNKGPTQAVIAGVVAELEINTEAKFQAKRDLHDGNYVLHSDSTNKPTVEVPRRFDIGVHVFEGLDIAYVVPVRLYFTAKDGALLFKLQFTNLPQILDEAWKAVTDAIRAGLPAHVLAINVPE